MWIGGLLKGSKEEDSGGSDLLGTVSHFTNPWPTSFLPRLLMGPILTLGRLIRRAKVPVIDRHN